MTPRSYFAKGGIRVTREIRNRDYQPADTALARALEERRGVLFSSSFEFPGRYTRWDMGFVDPPVQITARGRGFSLRALNARGDVLLGPIEDALKASSAVGSIECEESGITGWVIPPPGRLPEEELSKQATM